MTSIRNDQDDTGGTTVLERTEVREEQSVVEDGRFQEALGALAHVERLLEGCYRTRRWSVSIVKEL